MTDRITCRECRQELEDTGKVAHHCHVCDHLAEQRQAAREAYAPTPRTYQCSHNLPTPCRDADHCAERHLEPLARQRTLRDILEGRWY